MLIKKICILGGTGFVGKTLANRLTREGYQLRVLTRNRERNRDKLILLPSLELIETDIHDPEQLKEQMAGCDAVINLVGILNEKGHNGSGFHHAHVELAEKIIEASQATGIRRILQMSALNADADSGPSHYLRTKGKAEERLHAVANIYVTSFRPSVIFGANDSFFNRFAELLKLSPLFFPLACPKACFAPVFVENVADAFARTINSPDSYGKHYDLCGPKTYSLLQLVEYTAKCMNIKKKIIPLPDVISRIQAASFDLTGFIFAMLGVEKPFSMDNYLSTRIDSICKHNCLGDLGITPVALESVVPKYLSNKFQKAEYNNYRQQSRRNYH